MPLASSRLPALALAAVAFVVGLALPTSGVQWAATPHPASPSHAPAVAFRRGVNIKVPFVATSGSHAARPLYTVPSGMRLVLTGARIHESRESSADHARIRVYNPGENLTGVWLESPAALRFSAPPPTSGLGELPYPGAVFEPGETLYGGWLTTDSAIDSQTAANLFGYLVEA